MEGWIGLSLILTLIFLTVTLSSLRGCITDIGDIFGNDSGDSGDDQSEEDVDFRNHLLNVALKVR